jgi:hypothetical protein
MLDPTIVKKQIENLKYSFPALLEDDEAWIATLDSETSFNDLLTSIVRRLEDTKALVIGTKDRFEELKARKDRFEHRIDTLRNLLFKLMQAAELPKLELPECTLSLRAGTQQLVGSADPEELPDELCKISRDLNRTAIKEALKGGGAVPGFSLSNSPPSLSVRVK